MTYLEAVELIKEIERKYEVMSIRYKGVKVWSYLRLYLQDSITTRRERKVSASIVKLVLKCLFSYNPLQLFGKSKLWIFTGCERRKQIGDKMVHRVSGGVTALYGNFLMVEKPSIEVGHYKKNEIEEKKIISESWLLILTHFLEFAFRPFKPRIEREEILLQLLNDNHIQFDYMHYLRLLNAQRIAVRSMISFAGRPQMVMMESPYDTMGYMWAFHQKGVKVVELQHGVLNRNHNAYNAVDYEHQMNPDCICVFGEEEYNYFTTDKVQYAPKVKMTGLYMLERADEFFKCDVFKQDRRSYKGVVVASGQANAEKELSEFVKKLSKDRKDLLFIYIPRYNDGTLHFSEDNVRLLTNVNIYEYLKWADVHLTVSSTTCLEAHYYHTPTVFYNLNNLSREYYGHILKEQNGAFYIEDTSQFNEAIKKLQSNVVEWKELFAHNHKEKIKELINEYLEEN